MRGSAQGPRHVARERGQALVEFVLILPVFLLITFGVIEFGKGLNYWIDVTHLSNEGARYAAVDRWPTCTESGGVVTCPEPLEDYLTDRANTQELASGLEIDICFPADGTPAPLVGDAVRVRVGTDYTLGVVDGLLGFLGMDGAGTIKLRSAATMRLEQLPARVQLEATTPCPS